ncbi:MAG: hypothetical protein D6805_00240, partial [Planctomycetota bacterium]
ITTKIKSPPPPKKNPSHRLYITFLLLLLLISGGLYLALRPDGSKEWAEAKKKTPLPIKTS